MTETPPELELHGRRFRHPETGFEGTVVGTSVYFDGRPAEALLQPDRKRRKPRWHLVDELEPVANP